MRKVFIAFSLLTVSVLGAQAQTTFGVHGNGILASMKGEFKDDNGETQKQEGKNRFSWKAGVFANVPLAETFSFMPQLNLLSKGTKIDQKESVDFFGTTYSVDLKGESKLTYLELPLYFVYNSYSETGGFFGGVGPVLSYGIGGKEEITSTVTIGGDTQTESGEYDVKFDGKENSDNDNVSHYKALEFGAGIIAGYRLANGLFINAHYNLGLSNISPDKDSKVKNRYVGFGIGYTFGGGN
jgi:hypothetical protein